MKHSFCLLLFFAGTLLVQSQSTENVYTTEILDTLSLDNFYSEIKFLSDDMDISQPDLVEYLPYNKIIIDTVEYYNIEGDLLLREREAIQHLLSTIIPRDSVEDPGKLVVEIRDSKVVRWPNNALLKYSISQNSFASDSLYQVVKKKMKQAVREWESVCNVRFFHDETKDALNIFSPEGDQTFVVLGYDAMGDFIASAFFPYTPQNERRILIDPSYFSTSFNQTGVFRHELGHVLGFRHEHIRSGAPKECPNENTQKTFDMTPYDPRSVMHYFCGGMGSMELKISANDIKGAQAVYGPPQ